MFDDLAHRGVELLAAVAAFGAEDVAGQAFAVDPHQHVLLVLYIAVDQREVLERVHFGAVGGDPEFTEDGGQPGVFAADDEVFVAAAVGDEVGHRAPLEVEFLAELVELRNPRHGAVVVHDFADHTGRGESGEAGEVDRRLGVPGAAQHAARTRDEREQVARRNEIGVGRGRVDQRLDRLGAVEGGDSGGGPLFRIDALGERRSERIGERRRGGQVQLLGPLGGERRADESARMGGHEGDRLRRDVGGGEHQVAFVFAVFVVGDDDHFPGPDVGDEFLDRIECNLVHSFLTAPYLKWLFRVKRGGSHWRGRSHDRR